MPPLNEASGQVYSLVPTVLQPEVVKQGIEAPLFKNMALLQVKGSKSAAVKEVPIRVDSMNPGDVFILDTGSMLYQWNGKQASKLEIDTANILIDDIIKNRGLTSENKVLVNQGKDIKAEQAMLEHIPNKKKMFGSWGYVVKRYKMKSPVAAGSDESVKPFTKRMFTVTLSNGKPKFVKRINAKVRNGEQVFAYRKLNSADCILVDDGLHIWIWAGRNAILAKNDTLLRKAAEKYMAHNNRPTSLPVTIVKDGDEPKKFLNNFIHERKKKWFQ